jgi:hypothetical protein
MPASSHPAVWRSGIPIPVTLPDMTVVGPTEMGISEHEHPEVQISMTFVAQSSRGKTKAIMGSPTHFSLHPSGMPHGRKSDGAQSLATVFSRAYMDQAADEFLRRSRIAMLVLLFCSEQFWLFHLDNVRWALQRTLFREVSKKLPGSLADLRMHKSRYSLRIGPSRFRFASVCADLLHPR